MARTKHFFPAFFARFFFFRAVPQLTERIEEVKFAVSECKKFELNTDCFAVITLL